MGVRTKTLVTVLMVGAAIGALSFTSTSKNLFKGQLMGEKDTEAVETSEEETTLLPDLRISVDLTTPATAEEDLIANVTISNDGEGAVEGGEEFIYEIEINNEQVLSNSDSYSALEKGDSFTFSYPIPKSIYQYDLEGEVVVKVDVGNNVKEADEGNNEASVNYNYLIER